MYYKPLWLSFENQRSLMVYFYRSVNNDFENLFPDRGAMLNSFQMTGFPSRSLKVLYLIFHF